MEKAATLVALILLCSAQAAVVGPLHPQSWVPMGAGGDAGLAIDKSVGDYSTWWRFVAKTGTGADFKLGTACGISVESVTISAVSTGHKDFYVKRADGGYDGVYSIGPLVPAGPSSGTARGTRYLQPDCSIIVGVRISDDSYFHYVNDIAVSYEASAAAPTALPTVTPPLFRRYYGEQKQASNATLGAPVNFTILIYGRGKGTCDYGSLPKDRAGTLRVANASVQNTTERAWWQCDLDARNYTLEFQMPAPELAQYGWNMTSRDPPELSQVEGVRNPSSKNYSNASGNYACYAGLECNATSFFHALLSAGEERNATIRAFPRATGQPQTGGTLVISEEGNRTAIRIPGSFEPGLRSFGAVGRVRITDPSGRTFEREAGENGMVSFVFDREGEWKIAQDGTEAKVLVAKERKAQAAQQPKETSALASAQASPDLLWLLALLLALSYAAYRLFYRRCRLSKVFANGKVKIAVKNRGSALKGLALMDVAPEGKASGFSETPAETRETLSGTVFKWRRSSLAKGETWKIEYALDADEAEKLKHAELRAETGSGKRVEISS